MPPRAAAPSARSADTPAPQPLPGEAGTTRQLQERFQRQYMLPRLRQQPGEKKKKPAADFPSCAPSAPGSCWVRWQMPQLSVFLALKCFAGSECSPRRYIPICRSNHQQLNRGFSNMKVLYLARNHVLLRREQRVRGEHGLRPGTRAAPPATAGPQVWQ